MFAMLKGTVERRLNWLLGAGLIMRTHGGSGIIEDGPGLIILCAVLGAFCGLIFGLLTIQAGRFVFFLLGRNCGLASWAVASTLLGAVLFACIAARGEDE